MNLQRLSLAFSSGIEESVKRNSSAGPSGTSGRAALASWMLARSSSVGIRLSNNFCTNHGTTTLPKAVKDLDTK